MDRVNALLESIDRLPSLPGHAAALLAALLSPDPELGEVKKIVRSDEGLTAAVLRRANSSLHGAPGQVFDLDRSVVRLGVRPLIRVALEQQVTETLAGSGRAYGLRRRDAWTGALFGAVAAEQLASELKIADPALAFSCAILRDIGKLVVDSLVGEDDLAYLGTASDEARRSFLELERDRLGADHAEIGAALARRWDFPETMALAIARHHEPIAEGEDGHDPLHDIVHAADTMALWAGLATGHDGLRYPLAEHVQKNIFKNNRRVERLLSDAWTGYRELADADAAANTEQAA